MTDAIEAIRDEVADKYDHKTTGLTFDEALEAAVLGYRVRYDALQAGSYVMYEFNGWRHEFSHDGKPGSSCTFHFSDEAKAASWSIFELRPPARDAWGQVAADLDTDFVPTGDVIAVFGLPDLPHPVAEVTTIVRAERTWDDVMSDKERTEGGWRDKPKRDSWGRPIE